MSFHRIVSIPARQVHEGDRVIVYRNTEYNFVSFNTTINHNQVDRERVVDAHLDHADGTIYIQTESGYGEFKEPHDHIQLDCKETFGKNTGDVF